MQLFVPLLWIGCGISLFAGVQFCVFGLMRRQERVFLAFGVLCLLVGIYMLFSAQWYHAQSVTVLAGIARFEMGIICLIYPVFIWFLGLYTYRPALSNFLLFVILFYGLLFVINLSAPYSFLYESIAMDDPIRLPWGEVVSSFKLKTAAIAWPYYAVTYSIFAWSFIRCVSLWRDRHKSRAVAITVYLTLQMLAILHAELIDNLNLRSVYLGEFAFIGLVMLVTTSMVFELRSRSVDLEENIASLQSETVRRKEYEQQLSYIAYHDYLTELPNRRALTEQLQIAIAHCAETNTLGAMLIIDLDHFKMINDSLGHELGDQLLQLVAQRLKNINPDIEQPIRLGGDEFAVLRRGLPQNEDLAEAETMEFARGLSSEIVKPYRVAEHELVIGASIGIAVFGGQSRGISEIMRRADMALYRAKSAGRNSIDVFAPKLKREADRRLAIERNLRAAIEHGEIELHFQPQVDSQENTVGAEVLSRWRHPELGSVPPVQFIPAAEESGLIHALGEYVLWQACQNIKKWKTINPNYATRLSINVSPWQIEKPGFTKMVKNVLDTSGVDPRLILIEITESTFMRDFQRVSETIRELNAYGIAFSIDDFGTGYSALAWLKKLSLNEIKIDKMFIHDMLLGSGDKIIDTILAIARNTAMRVVAEGVETVEQRMALESLGCRFFQGFLFSPALPEAGFLSWQQHHPSIPA